MIFSNILYFYKRKIGPGFKVGKNKLVVDIGSGDKPFWRADVFVDDLSLGDVQRTSHTKTIHDLGKFFDSDVCVLPFKDKVFDFSFCSHLLEHVENPGIAIKEITRVSRAGYIEVPNGILESVMPFISHIWFIYRNGNKLIFVRKSKKIHNILSHNGGDFTNIINNAHDPFIRMYWRGKIEYEIIDDLKKSEKYFSPTVLNDKKKHSNSKYMFLVKFLRTFFYKKKMITEEFLLK